MSKSNAIITSAADDVGVATCAFDGPAPLDDAAGAFDGTAATDTDGEAAFDVILSVDDGATGDTSSTLSSIAHESDEQ